MSILGESPDASPLVRVIRETTETSLRNTTMGDREVLLARLAVLVAIDAPQMSYLMNLASGVGGTRLDAEEVQGLLTAVTPLVGTARVVAAAEKISDALGFPISLIDLLAQS